MSRLLPYVVSLLAVAVALGVRLLLNPWLGENRPFLLFVAAVAVSAWFGGTRAGIFAMVLGYLAANIFLIPPVGSFDFHLDDLGHWVNLLTFVLVSGFVIGPIAALRHAQSETLAAAEQVRELLAQAEQEDRQKDRFLATLSHELRGPLAALASGLDLLSMADVDRTTLDHICPLMSRQLRQITRLVGDLMDVARVSQGRMQLEKSRVDLCSLVAQTVETSRPILADRGQQLHIELSVGPLLIDGDEVRLTQVLSNLLGNAAKYTARGGTIWVAARRERDRAVVSVRDNGPGIPRDKLLTIFEMFSQLNTTLDRAQGGLGIGLFLAQQVVELHQGRIEARSDGEGSGAEFIVSLPCRGSAPLSPPATAAPAASGPAV